MPLLTHCLLRLAVLHPYHYCFSSKWKRQGALALLENFMNLQKPNGYIEEGCPELSDEADTLDR